MSARRLRRVGYEVGLGGVVSAPPEVPLSASTRGASSSRIRMLGAAPTPSLQSAPGAWQRRQSIDGPFWHPRFS